MSDESRGRMASMVGFCIVMIILQGLLLMIHHPKHSRSLSGQVSPAELFVGVTIFWASQRCAGWVLEGMRAILSFGLSALAPHHGERPGNHRYGGLQIADVPLSSIWDSITSLFELVLITWFLHLALAFVLDTGIPFWLELRQSPQKAAHKVDLRLKEILNILQSTFQHPFSGFLVELSERLRDENSKAKGQAIHLERRQTDYPSAGQRRLSWNIVVDEEAMDEMKETLGPPGGFGELGFNVAKDGVRFEAMGVGTSFNLMFKLREDEDAGLERETRGKQE
jgi:hypothetical protein